MSLISKVQSYFYNYYLKQRLKLERFERNAMDFDQTKSIGILFDATEDNSRKEVMKYAELLSKNGKQVKLLGFINDKLKEASFPFKYFTKQNLSWSLVPKGTEIEEFIKKDFDVLINLYLPDRLIGLKNLPIEYISTFSKADLRVGPFSENHESYDLIIDTPQGTDLQHLIKQVDFFLNRINSPVYETAVV